MATAEGTEVKGDEVVTLSVIANPAAMESKTALQLQGRADKLVCEKVEDEGPIADLADELDAAWKRADEGRQFFVKPLNEHVKRINDAFRPTLDGLKAAKTRILGLIDAFRLKERRRVAEEQRIRDEAQQKAAAEARAMQQQGVPASTIAQVIEPPPPPPAPAPTGISRGVTGAGVGGTKRPAFEVVDFSKVADEYKQIVEAVVVAAIRARVSKEKATEDAPDTTTIPGVKCWWDEKAGRTGKR